MAAKKSVPQGKKTRRTTHVTIQRNDQRAIYLHLLKLQDAIVTGDQWAALALIERVIAEMPFNEVPVNAAKYIHECEKYYKAEQEGRLASYLDSLIKKFADSSENDLANADDMDSLRALWG